MPSRPGRAGPPLHIAVPIWGADYVRTFLTYSLPTQLSPKNLPGLKAGPHVYSLFTTREDYDRISESRVFHQLSGVMEVQVTFIEDELKRESSLAIGQKYEVKSNCYRQAFATAHDKGAAVVPSNADIVFADGFFGTLEALVESGKRAVQVPGPRGLREPIGQVLVSQYQTPAGVIVIDPFELTALWMKHIHPLLDMHFVDGLPEGGRFNPSHLYWRVQDEGIVARCFNLHPYIVYPRRGTVDFSTTVDDDLIERLGLSERERFFAQDSRQIFCCELSPPEQYVGDLARRGDLARYVEVYASWYEHNMRNLKKEILITATRTLGPQWRQRRKQSAAFTKHLLKEYEREMRRRARRARADKLRSCADDLRDRYRRVGAAVWRTGTAVRQMIPEPLKPMLRRIRNALRRARDFAK